MPAARSNAAGRRLIAWFAYHARSLPWRAEPRDPYAVLVSELMLQQTQVDRVVPCFEAFMKRFPVLEAVAQAHEDEVVRMWSGLGYYRRARLLHRLAQQVSAAGGQLPATASALAELPGVGPYTAAAVASLAHGEAVPVVDGNVTRVAARVLAFEEDPRGARGQAAVAAWVRELMAGHPSGLINEGLMELGATVCTLKAPQCRRCPLAPGCQALATGRSEALPPPRRVRSPEAHLWVAACGVDDDGLWLLRQVQEGPILRSLWLPPFAELDRVAAAKSRARQLLPFAAAGTAAVGREVRHSITHRRIRIVPVVLRLDRVPDPGSHWQWVNPARPEVATSSLLAKLVAAV